MFSFFRKASAPSSDLVSHDELLAFCNDANATIIDVREPSEYASGRVPGARNLPLSRFNPDEIPRDRPVILICQAGGRSARALAACRSAGIENVRHYKSGTGGWIAKNGPIER